MRTATILRHVHFEDLGSLAPVLADLKYQIEYRSIGDADFLNFDPCAPDLLVVLGGPVGVYEEAAYPFLRTEKDLIATRLAQKLPTLGICLGAQLIAAALGAKVYPSGVKEIGFSPISLTAAGMDSPLRHLRDIQVLHWHGDTYDLPPGAVHLASTRQVAQQAYTIEDHVLALQCHAEVDARSGFDRWLVGHASELASARVDIGALRADAERYGQGLVTASERSSASGWAAFLFDDVDPAPGPSSRHSKTSGSPRRAERYRQETGGPAGRSRSTGSFR